jgi:CubicO group peptidase (beta-lactamase class C family)
MKIRIWVLLLPISLGLACTESDRRPSGGHTIDSSAFDDIFTDFVASNGPGCAFAVSHAGQVIETRAYGSANLEHAIQNTPETIFEPGSVSKQFTAAATVLLALDGEISLDDDIRDYLPEIPDYGEVIRVRDLLNHTSGLRDWGSIAGIGGWPRTTRIHTHTHMLDIASRQRALNYPPGQYYSYTNTGYNLQAVLIERVTGQTFEEFSQERVFQPLGMTKTQWRNDFSEIVQDRSVAYRHNSDGSWNQLMPFENVHGNGGLLTTVGDLLKFTHNLDTGETVGGPEFVAHMHQQGVLNSGREIDYASGLRIGEYRGVREVQHSGSTAGYRGHLTRFPDQEIAVSVMCNTASANAGSLAHSVADLYLENTIDEQMVPIAGIELPTDKLRSFTGRYRNTRTNTAIGIVLSEGTLFLQESNFGLGEPVGSPLTPVSETRLEASALGATIEFENTSPGERASATYTIDGVAARLEPVDDFTPTIAGLAGYVGKYHSDEAEVTYTIVVRDGALAILDRYDRGQTLKPIYPDAFSARAEIVMTGSFGDDYFPAR